jgi:hypothetical protein
MNVIMHMFQCNSFEELLYLRAQPSQVGKNGRASDSSVGEAKGLNFDQV